MRNVRFWIAVAVCMLSVTACGGGNKNPTLVTPSAPAASDGSAVATTPPPGGSALPGTSGLPAPSPTTPPSLSLVKPVQGATVPAGDVAVEVFFEGVKMVDKIGQPPVAGEGHLIFYFGVDFIPTRAGQPATTAEGTFAKSMTASHTWPAVAPGRYGIGAQLVNNDDTPLSPSNSAFATITVQ